MRDEPFAAVEGKRRVLVTGGAGRIGSYFAETHSSQYDLRLLVRGDEAKIDQVAEFGEVVVCDIADLEGLNQACEGIDTIVHLAADHRVSATWEDLLPNNIVGTYNLFEAAKTQGCRRVIYASSVNAVAGYPRGTQLRPEDPINPPNLYGASKCFGEALCRLYSHKSVSGIVLRIAAYETFESMRTKRFEGMQWAFVSHRDLAQLIGLCIDDLRLQFAIFYGVSKNTPCLADLSNARELLGYKPVDNIFQPES
ncbi:MAG: NAD(P)-dependent oxidoreductase [Fimbriimonas sp.]|nr:NAD(P)-dependent oxidoreductase [Fimbriimonas sp.]